MHTITPGSAFPTITGPAILDGWSQPGFAGAPIIELNGTNAGANVSGLTLGAGSSGSVIRGLVINSFQNEGVDIFSSNNVVLGNYLGTDATGMVSRGNANDGIEIANGANNTIGGLTVAERNIISGNGLGIRIAGSTSAGNVIVGNYIGANASGVASLGNRLHGVFFSSLGIAGTTIGDPHNNRLGGTTAPEANLIVNNGAGGGGWDGVSLRSSAGIVANAILGNSIYANGDLGIDLGNDGVTPDDAGDADTGPNNLQNFPVLTSAQIAASSQVTVAGSLNSLATNYFRVEFFASAAADAAGYGEGQRYLGFTNLTTAGNGNVSFTAALSAPVAGGEFISATATKANSTFTAFTDTSEFAGNVPAVMQYDVGTTVTGPTIVYANTNFTYTISVTNLGSLAASNIVVSDTLPAGLNVVGISGGGSVIGGGPGQVVFDQASSNNVPGITNWTHVTTSAANRLLLVGVSFGYYTTSNSPAVVTLSYGGANLTKVRSATNGIVTSELWQLVNPPSGTNTIALTYVGAPTTVVAGAATFSGVDPVTPLSAVISGSGPKTAGSSVTISSATNEIVFDTITVDKWFVPNCAVGQTKLWSIGPDYEAGAGSIKPGTNFVNMSWTLANCGWADIAASVKAAGLIGVVNWTIPTLAAGAMTNFTVTVTAPLGGTLSNSVSSTATTPDANAANNDGSAAAAQVLTTVTPVADVVVTQTGSMTVSPLTNYTYTVTVSNAGPCTAGGVVVSDTLAPTLTYVSSSAGGSYLAGVVTWPAVASLYSGFTTNFTVTVRAPISGTLTNTAAGTAATLDPNPANNNGSFAAAQVITAVSPLQIANTSKGAAVQTLNWSHTVDPGSSRILIVALSIDSTSATVNSATFAGLPTLTLIGQTNSAQTKVLLYQMLNPQVGTYPISINLSSAVGIVGGAASFNGVNQATPIKAFAGKSGTGTNASVTVASALGGVVIDAVAPKSPQFATSAGPAQNIEWNLSGVNYSGAGGSSYGAATVSPSWTLNSTSAWAMAAVALNSATVLADVTVAASGPASVLATSNVTYTITVTNLGSSTASNVVVSDVLPAGATFVNASSGGTNNGGVVTWPALVNFVNGARTNYTVTITAPANGALTNIVYSTAITADPDPSNNNGTGTNNQVVTTITGLADVAATVTGPAAVFAGTNFSYQVSVTNQGPSTASTVLVSNALPAAALFVSASGDGSNNAGVVTWSLSGLAMGAVSNFAVTVTAPAGGVLTNAVSSTALTSDLNAANNNGSASNAQVVTTVIGLADLATLVSGPAAVFAGATYSYTVLVTNQGPSAAGNVLASDLLPPGVAFVTASGGGSHSGGVVTWPVMASLNNGAATSFTVTVTAPVVGSLINVVAGTSATSDPDLVNNNGTAPSSQVATAIVPRPTISGQRLPDGSFQLQLVTLPNAVVAIEASTNLLDWQTLGTTNSGSGAVSFLDPNAASYPQRFYRSRQAP